MRGGGVNSSNGLLFICFYEAVRLNILFQYLFLHMNAGEKVLGDILW